MLANRFFSCFNPFIIIPHSYTPVSTPPISMMPEQLPNPHNFNFHSYCSIDDLNSVFFYSSNTQLKIISLNCRSLAKSFIKLKILLQTISNRPELIALSETWISANDSNFYSIQGYNLILIPRPDRRGGGVGFYIDANIDYIVRSDLRNSLNVTSFEVIIIELRFKNMPSVFIINCHKPPTANPGLFNDQLSALLDTIDRNGVKHTIVVLGDFNIDLFNSSTNTATKFLDSMSLHNLYPSILTATRVTEHHQSLIDNIFVSPCLNTSTSGVVLEDISDHYPVFIKLNIDTRPK